MKNKKGFSLLEVIISIGYLAILSGFILEMFVISSNLNQKAQDLDKGTIIAMNYIEKFKSSDSIDEFIFDNFSGNILKNDDSSFVISNYYDKNWNKIENYSDDIKEDVEFVVNININNLKNNGESYIAFNKENKEIIKNFSGFLGKIKTEVINYKQPIEKQVMVSLDTEKYFNK